MQLQTGLGKVKDLTPSVWDIVKWDRDCGDKLKGNVKSVLREKGRARTLYLVASGGCWFNFLR